MPSFLSINDTKFTVEKTVFMRNRPLAFFAKAEVMNKKCHYLFFEIAKEKDSTDWLAAYLPTSDVRAVLSKITSLQEAFRNTSKCFVIHQEGSKREAIAREASESDIEKIPVDDVYAEEY